MVRSPALRGAALGLKVVRRLWNFYDDIAAKPWALFEVTLAATVISLCTIDAPRTPRLLRGVPVADSSLAIASVALSTTTH